MAFKVFGSYNSYTASNGSAGSGDQLFNITINANGDTGKTLPANALIKAIVLKGTAGATIRLGSLDIPELLIPDTTIVANQRESFPSFISLPALLPIYAAGIVGVVSVTFVYQIVTL